MSKIKTSFNIVLRIIEHNNCLADHLHFYRLRKYVLNFNVPYMTKNTFLCLLISHNSWLTAGTHSLKKHLNKANFLKLLIFYILGE